ncbi:MAG: peptidase S10 [Planctomycetes bacterium]|nr:peptidase S10 [Planctomycetota bacterium]
MRSPAEEPKVDKKSEDKNAEKPPIITEHDVTIGGAAIHYRATTGLMPLLDDYGKSKASIFYIAYEKLERNGDVWVKPANRPVTYTFNGGPGSSSVWLHLGAIGPRRVVFGDEGQAPTPPGVLADNEYSWLDLTDLVFIDPVSTGYSRAAEGEDAGRFHGLNEDARAVADFIRLWTTRNDRWLSPKFLAGESYGTTRAAALSGELQERLGMYLNGITLISMVLNFQTLSFDQGNDEAYWLFLPTYTATAFYHKKLAPPLDQNFEKTLDQAREFAEGEYLLALAKGDQLSEAERGAIADKLSKFTGLSRDFILRSDLRVPIFAFTKELLRDQGRTVGRLDSRYKGYDRDETSKSSEYDPSYSVILGPFTAALNAYIREELKYESDVNYEILTGRVHPWKFPSDSSYPDVSETLATAIRRNPDLRVSIECGYFDLATPFFASEYTVNHMDLPKELRKNIRKNYYKSGHMMYIRKEDLAALKENARKFYSRVP